MIKLVYCITKKEGLTDERYDEANFIDHGKVAYFVSEEHVIMDELRRER